MVRLHVPVLFIVRRAIQHAALRLAPRAALMRIDLLRVCVIVDARQRFPPVGRIAHRLGVRARRHAH